MRRFEDDLLPQLSHLIELCLHESAGNMISIYGKTLRAIETFLGVYSSGLQQSERDKTCVDKIAVVRERLKEEAKKTSSSSTD
jgi:hypothetical protein